MRKRIAFSFRSPTLANTTLTMLKVAVPFRGGYVRVGPHFSDRGCLCKGVETGNEVCKFIPIQTTIDVCFGGGVGCIVGH